VLLLDKGGMRGDAISSQGERPPNQIITFGTFTYPLRTPRIKFITKKAPMMTIEMK